MKQSIMKTETQNLRIASMSVPQLCSFLDRKVFDGDGKTIESEQDIVEFVKSLPEVEEAGIEVDLEYARECLGVEFPDFYSFVGDEYVDSLSRFLAVKQGACIN